MGRGDTSHGVAGCAEVLGDIPPAASHEAVPVAGETEDEEVAGLSKSVFKSRQQCQEPIRHLILGPLSATASQASSSSSPYEPKAARNQCGALGSYFNGL